MPSRSGTAGLLEELAALSDDVVCVADAPGLPAADQRAEARLALLERQLSKRLAVEAQQIEHEVDERVARGLPGAAFCSAWKLVRPSGRSITTSPSISASRARRSSAALATSGKRGRPVVAVAADERARPFRITQPMR